MTGVDAALLESFGLDPGVLHLNHGAFGVAPVAVRRVAAAWRDRAERNPHRFNRVELPPLIAAARERAAGFLGIEASRAAWVRNVSEGLSAVLGSLELRSGDELVISTHGYGAVGMALRHHAARAGRRSSRRPIRSAPLMPRSCRRTRRPAQPGRGWSWSTGSPHRPLPSSPLPR